jgi:hypothetical protein
MKQPQARYMIGSITTKDLGLWSEIKELQSQGETLESILRRGAEELQKEIDKHK